MSRSSINFIFLPLFLYNIKPFSTSSMQSQTMKQQQKPQPHNVAPIRPFQFSDKKLAYMDKDLE